MQAAYRIASIGMSGAVANLWTHVGLRPTPRQSGVIVDRIRDDADGARGRVVLAVGDMYKRE